MISERTFWLGLLVMMLLGVVAGYLLLSWGGRTVDWSLVLLYACFASGAYMFFIRSFVKPERR
jgi:hypothetical protein